MKYKMLSSYTADNLEQEINELLDIGWQPYGNPIIVVYSERLVFYQAMVKSE